MKSNLIYMKNKLGTLPRYTLYSIISTALDFALVWVLTFLLGKNLVVANTIGALSGFFLHYILASRSVFNTEYGAIGFVVYLSTFLFGLIIGNITIYYTYMWLDPLVGAQFAFILSKLLSVIIPFFIVYTLRVKIFKILGSDHDAD